VNWDFGRNTFPPNWERFDTLMEGALQRIPDLERAEVIGMVNYPDALTPDGNPCLGPVPGFPGLYVAAGMSLNGFGGGGGMGKILAEWIIEGEPSLDMHEFNLRRFGPIYQDIDFLVQRAREAYKYYYHLRYPNDENEWGRPRRVSPLFGPTKALGAVFGEKNGWERPNYYEPRATWRHAGAEQRRWGWGRPTYLEQVAAEHRAVRERVALADLSSFGKIDLRGPGALPLLQRLADNDVDRPVGCVIYTQFLNLNGGIESDLTITRLEEDHFRVITGSAFIYNDLGWIRMHQPTDDSVEVRDVSESWACLGLWGPSAREVLQSVTEDDVSNASLPYMRAKTLRAKEFDILAQRVSYVGELGWELYVSPRHAAELWDLLLQAGQPFRIQPVGYKAVDSLRLEKGYRYWSVDLTPAENPFEAGLGFCVRLEKGDFIGREALLEIKKRGLHRKLRTLVVDIDPWSVYGGEAIHKNGSVVSRVRSIGYGHTVGQAIALSYLPLELSAAGTQVEVEVFGRRCPAEVVEDVLYDPKGERLKA
jgi:4-methylaminobutanoate oxidase (formaldehyde-forming)